MLMKIEMAPVFFLKICDIKFCENPFDTPQVFVSFQICNNNTCRRELN